MQQQRIVGQLGHPVTTNQQAVVGQAAHKSACHCITLRLSAILGGSYWWSDFWWLVSTLSGY